MKEKIKIFLVTLIVLMIPVLAVIGIHSKKTIDLKKIVIGNKEFGGSKIFSNTNNTNTMVTFDLLTGIDNMALRLKVKIPCDNMAQKKDILEKLPKINHAFIMAMNDSSMKKHVKDRDFELLRKRIIQIVNAFAEKPVDTLYFENYFLN